MRTNAKTRMKIAKIGLDAGLDGEIYTVVNIEFLNLVVSSPFETRPYNNDCYGTSKTFTFCCYLVSIKRLVALN